MSGVVVPEGERATRGGEIARLLASLYTVARITAVGMLAYILWQAGLIVAHAARIYTACGFIYWETESLPRCMRGIIDQKYWLDLMR